MKTPHPVDRHVGDRVRIRRTMASMSQTKLGDALGITFQQVQKYEKGANRISASRLQQIARILKVPVPFFFEDAPGGSGRGDRFKGAPSTAYVSEFVDSADGLALVKAFRRINDAKVRRQIVSLIEAISDRR